MQQNQSKSLLPLKIKSDYVNLLALVLGTAALIYFTLQFPFP